MLLDGVALQAGLAAHAMCLPTPEGMRPDYLEPIQIASYVPQAAAFVRPFGYALDLFMGIRKLSVSELRCN